MASKNTASNASGTNLTYRQVVHALATTPVDTFKACGLHFVLKYPMTREQKARVMEIAKGHAGCNACRNRAVAYVGLRGPNGPIFMDPALIACASDPAFAQLRALAEEICSSGTPEMLVITDQTFAPLEEGHDETGRSFHHWTVCPDGISTPEMCERVSNLRAIQGTTMDGRLSKLLESPDTRASIRIMEEERPKLERPDHWGRVLAWVLAIIDQFPKNWDEMSDIEKCEVRAFALTTGAVEGSAHKDFFQASNIVDFLTKESRDDLRAEMDRRSHPDYYQVSQLNRRLMKEGVTADRLIGLTWPGEFKDDLDIHVFGPSGSHIYFSNKKTPDGRLDFDANVSGGEAEPCENVSCSKDGTYRVEVNNYTRRTHGRPIPFTVVIREKGCSDIVIEGVWPADRLANGDRGQRIVVCTHTFGAGAASSSTSAAPALSEKAARRVAANADHWEERVGDPKAMIATDEDLLAADCPVIRPEPSVSTSTSTPVGDEAAASSSASVGSSFMAMAATASEAPRSRRTLAENCAANPTTVTELMALVAEGGHTLQVIPRDHSPGYAVDIQTATTGVRKSRAPASCHYRNKFELPVKPDASSNARLDPSWGMPYTSPVDVAYATQIDGKWFLALADAHLPQSEDYPLGGGFYPTDLTADFHVHRERWTYYHSQLRPVMKDSGTPAIGTFLVSSTAVVYLDGVKMTLTNQ